MFERPAKLVLNAMLAICAAGSAHAQMSQDPLLSHTASVESNIVFMFDDSGSMSSNFLYQYGGSAGYNGMSGPSPTTYTAKSPDVNRLYYDPRKTYPPRIKADGTTYAAGSISGISSFNVYFYKPASTSNYSVSSVTVSNKGSGYPSSGVTASFNTAPTGGTTATVSSITMATSMTAQSVAMTSKGSGYPATGVTATFSAPPSGGTTAVGTVTMGTSSNVSAVAVNSGGAGYPASGVTASFTPAPGAGGVPATATVTTTSTKTVASVNVTARGSGYPTTGKTVTFTAAPSGGVTATGTVTTATYLSVIDVTINSAGSGYPSGVGVTFSSPPAGGVTATGTVTRTSSASGRGIASITITNAGSGYTSAPTMTLTGTSPATAATFTVNTTSNVGVAGIVITNPGSGYTTAPTATLGGASSGSGATLAVVTGTSNVVSAVTVTNGGSGYSGTPSLVLANTGSGTGATFTVNTGATNVISGVTITNAGSGYTSAPTVSFSASSGSGAAASVATGTTYGISTINIGSAGTGYLATPVLTISTPSGSGTTWTVNTTVTPAAVINQKWAGVDTPTALTNYFNPSYLPDGGSPLAAGADTTLTYPNTVDTFTASTKYPKFRDRTDCGSVNYCAGTLEQQNYANWKTYYSTRLDMAKTGMGRAFQGLNPTFRLGWGTINTIASNSQLDAGVRLYDSTTQSAFFTWLYGLSTNGSTPNRIALDKVGQYYKRADNNGPWANSPPIGAAAVTSSTTEVLTHATCRRSYALLMTDGYYNDDGSISSSLNFSMPDFDTTGVTVTTTPSTYQYVPIGPYSDTSNNTKVANTFADVAMKYWLTDLRPNLANNVRTVSADPAYWQHMNFYAIGLGLTGTLDFANPQVLTSLTGSSSTRTLNWPTPVSNDPKSIDDMWHATINGRGKIFNAGTASELKDAVTQMLSDVKGASGDQAGVAVSTGIQLGTTTEKFTPTYDSSFWTGDVTATNIMSQSVAWDVEAPCTDTSLCPITEKPYFDLIPSASSRKIFVGNGATSGTRATPFTYSGMGSLTSQMTGTVSSALIDYLRGDASNEQLSINAANSAAIYRVRPNKLGDIVNSTPVFVKDTLDLGYAVLPAGTTGQSSYSAFLTAKRARPEGILVVGANDGMLHVFRDGIAPNQPGGIETFAYIPNALLPTLNQLADPAYNHRYYVDGPNIETDAYINGAWANIVIGSTGAGAGVASSSGVSPRAAVFAIDTTSVNNNTTSMNASSVLWEISSTSTGFGELGYMMSDVQAGPTLDGSWVAIFGNGYESASCRAQLFVVNMQNGALIRKIDTGAGGGNCTSNTNTNRNGLGGVRIVRNANQQIIGAYAGDLLGNLWKFNLNSNNPTAWGVDLGGTPLFTAGTTKPITAPPTVVSLPIVWTPAATPDHGQMVVIGTGKFFELGDIGTTDTQSLYGIWDPVGFGVATTAYAGVALTNNTLLVQQTIGAAQAGNIAGSTIQNTYFTISKNTIDYASKRGWQINLPNSGERIVFPLELLNLRYISTGTLSPANVSALDACNPTSAGTAFTYIVDALSGAGPSTAIFDTNGDGVINSSDLLVAGFQQQSADGRHVTMLVSSAPGVKVYCNVGGMTQGCIKEQLPDSIISVKTPAIKTRTWRQLFMR